MVPTTVLDVALRREEMMPLNFSDIFLLAAEESVLPEDFVDTLRKDEKILLNFSDRLALLAY